MENRKKKGLYPMKFVPVTDENTGESWQLADLGFRDSEVEGGWLAGSTLSEVLETYLEELVGEDSYSRFGRQFPLMVKLLSPVGTTPLMVCPDDDTARQRYDTLGKMKFWHVVDAEPGSRLYMGFKAEISAADLYRKCTRGGIEDSLNVIVPHRGDSFLIPPGLVHAASGGLTLVEIAECSDLDFKIYNWGRPDDPVKVSFGAGSGSRAEVNGEDVETLSLEAAFDFINMGKYDSSLTVKRPANAGKPAEKIVDVREFAITRMNLDNALRINAGAADSFLIYVCVKGSASVQIAGGDSQTERYAIKIGEVVLVPASVTGFFLVPEEHGSIVLEAGVEPCPEEDGYINAEAEADLPGDGGADAGMSAGEYLRQHNGD